MSSPFDAEARLAEGLPAVADVEAYVAACSRLGYQHGDLTARAAQVRDWYGTEDGLDLGALDVDCRAFADAASAAEDAAQVHADLMTRLATTWTGQGAAAAHEFLWRSGREGLAVGLAVRVVADALTSLRDELWRAVDEKVEAVQAIDGRHQAQRGEWLAAANAVVTGSGDVAAASELVDIQLKPFVRDDIGTDWVAAMRSATTTIDAAYDSAAARISAIRPAAFDVPGELGPRPGFTDAAEPTGGREAEDSVGARPAAAVEATIPAAAQPSSSPTAVPSAGFAPAGFASAPFTPATPVPPPLADSATALPPSLAMAPAASMPSPSDLAGAPSQLGGGPGGGAGGFGQQLADLIGGLFGSGSAAGESLGSDDPDPLADVDEPSADPDSDDSDDPDDPDDPDDSDDPDDPDDSDDPDDLDDPDDSDDPGDAEGATKPAEPELEPAATPVPPLESLPPVPSADGAAAPAGAAEPTPCDIAADELPQVGG